MSEIQFSSRKLIDAFYREERKVPCFIKHQAPRHCLAFLVSCPSSMGTRSVTVVTGFAVGFSC